MRRRFGWLALLAAAAAPLAWGVTAGRTAGAADSHPSLRIRGVAPAPLRPGLSERLDLTLVNRRRVPLLVTRLLVRATVDPQHRAMGCRRRDFAIHPIPRSAFPIRTRPRSARRLEPRVAPRLRMRNLSGRNQDACKGARLRLRYLGSVRRAP